MPDSTDQPTYAERRAAMAEETHTRILDACVTILARGVAALSIPAVAREARVSVPTVYRNFADKKTLVRETAIYLRDKRGTPSAPASLDELAEQIRMQFRQSASVPANVRAALASETVIAARHEEGEREHRIARASMLLEAHLHDLTPRDRERAILTTTVLCSSAALEAFREVVGTSPEEAAATVAWAIGRLVGQDLDSTCSASSRGGG